MQANYEIVDSDEDRVLIRDIGPWHQYKTITNAAEWVVTDLYKKGHLIEGQRLFYYDSLGTIDQIVHKNGRFVGFASGGREGI